MLNGQGIKETIINFALGKPMYHMWFMYMIICLYLLTPFLVNFRKTLAIKTIYITSFALLIWACLSRLVDGHNNSAAWNIGGVFSYLAIYCCGYSIYNFINKVPEHSNIKGMFYIISGIALSLCDAGILYYQLLNPSSAGLFDATDSFSPLILVASLLIFIGFSYMEIYHSYYYISSNTMNVYLLHVAIWIPINAFLIGRYSNSYGCGKVAWLAPLLEIVIFCISLIISIMLGKIKLKILHRK